MGYNVENDKVYRPVHYNCSEGIVYHYQASFVEPWIMLKRINSKEMIVLWNAMTA